MIQLSISIMGILGVLLLMYNPKGKKFNRGTFQKYGFYILLIGNLAGLCYFLVHDMNYLAIACIVYVYICVIKISKCY